MRLELEAMKRFDDRNSRRHIRFKVILETMRFSSKRSDGLDFRYCQAELCLAMHRRKERVPFHEASYLTDAKVNREVMLACLPRAQQFRGRVRH